MYSGQVFSYSTNLIDTPLAGKASHENDLSIAPLDLTNYKNWNQSEITIFTDNNYNLLLF
jgi:hypothetical protein